MEYTKKSSHLAFGVFLLTVLANIVSNGGTIDNLWLPLIIAFAIVSFGVLVDFSLFIFDWFRWRKFITPFDDTREKPYVSASVINRGKKQLKFFCVLKSIEYNGNINHKITEQITEHTSRVSWSGGSDEEVGIKIIDGEDDKSLNIVSLTNGKLAFETAKGAVISDFDKGVYKLNMQINRQISAHNFRKKNFHVVFEYFLEADGGSHIRLIKNL